MSVSVSPIAGAGWQFFDNNGTLLTGGKLYTYEAGTTTPEPTYTSSSGGTVHTNPIVLDSAGRVPNGGEVWLMDGQAYKFVLRTGTDVQLWSADNVSGIGDLSSLRPVIYNSIGDGTTVSLTLASAPISENTTNAYVSGVYQQKNTYSVTGVTLTFSEAPPSGTTIEVSYI